MVTLKDFIHRCSTIKTTKGKPRFDLRIPYQKDGKTASFVLRPQTKELTLSIQNRSTSFNSFSQPCFE